MIDLSPHADVFASQDELLHLGGVVTGERLAALQLEARRVEASAVHVRVPFVRSGGTVGARRLSADAPTIAALYDELAGVVSKLLRRPVYPKHDGDDHGFALYFYRGGDFMRLHHDMCGCAEGNSYSVTVGIVDDSSARLECRLPSGRVLAIATGPGSLTVYNGSRILHGVSKLGRGQHRVVLSGSYRTSATPDPIRHLAQRVTDGLLYYGIRGRSR